MRMALRKGKKVKVLAIEEGCRDVWYKATIIDNSETHCLIEYKDIVTDDLTTHLIEVVELHRVRPPPPPLKRQSFFAGVEARDRDGWWMGKVVERAGKNKYKIYFKQLDSSEDYYVCKLRPRQDWIDGQWVHVSKDLVDACINNGSMNTFIETNSLPCRNENVALCKITSSHEKKMGQISQKRFRQPEKLLGANSSGMCSSELVSGSQYDDLVSSKVLGGLESVKRTQLYKTQTTKTSSGESEKTKSNINVVNAVSESFDGILDTTDMKSILEFQSIIYGVTKVNRSRGSQVKETMMKRLQILAYQSVLLAFHHQGVLDWDKLDMLAMLRRQLNISNDTHSLILKHLESGDFD